MAHPVGALVATLLMLWLNKTPDLVRSLDKSSMSYCDCYTSDQYKYDVNVCCHYFSFLDGLLI